MAIKNSDYCPPKPLPSWVVAKDRETLKPRVWGPYRPQFKGGGILGVGRKGSRDWYQHGHWFNEDARQARWDLEKSPFYIESKTVRSITMEEALSEYSKA